MTRVTKGIYRRELDERWAERGGGGTSEITRLIVVEVARVRR